jgi:hypothetical protein
VSQLEDLQPSAAVRGILPGCLVLAYRLYTLCERKKRAKNALSYNGLVQSWPEITRLARQSTQAPEPDQLDLL